MKMKRIFQTASSMIAWLGAAADKSDMLMDLIERQGTFFLENRNKILVLSKIEAHSEFIQCMFEAEPPIIEIINNQQRSDYLESLRSLHDREYWYRIWILQELVLAKNITIAFGSKRTSLDAFELTSTSLIQIISS
jgi:hypothetical protein